jgi:sarcosine oxidase
MEFDIAVVGLGAMGSATARCLARAGARVVGFDRLRPPHSLGSTHGHTRIIREAYYEHPLYVPLVRRAYELWADLEVESGERLLQITGGLMAGPVSGPLVRGALESARAHGIGHDMLDARGIANRFPTFAPRPDWVGLFEHRAGMLFPERCVSAMLNDATSAGASLRFDERVRSWRADGRSVRIETERSSYTVGCIVVSAGPWLPELEESVGRRLPLEIERQLSHWFSPRDPDDARWAPGATPIALWEVTDDGEVFATFPALGPGVKCGMHHSGSATTPDTVDREVSYPEDEAARVMLDKVMPGAGGPLVESRVCLYTNTPDRHFLIDWVNPGRVLVVSPCSGHGFKFAPAIGELAAALALGERPWIDIAPFSLSRFA